MCALVASPFGPKGAIIRPPKEKRPATLQPRGVLKSKPDNVLLSREIHPTIIGAEAFHGPVRDGKGWFHLAIVVRLKTDDPSDAAPRSAAAKRSNTEEASHLRADALRRACPA